MKVYIVYSDDMELGPCIQAIFNARLDAMVYVDDLSSRMDSGTYAAEEYPYIKTHVVRDAYDKYKVKCPPSKANNLNTLYDENFIDVR